MFEFFVRSLIAVTLGVLILIAVLCALTVEAINDVFADRSAKSMRLRRNRRSSSQSYQLALEEVQT